MKCRLFPIGLLTILSVLSLQATPVTNWHTFRNTAATSFTGQGTSSPTVGTTAVPANSAFLVGYFNGVSLTNVGDRITLSYQVSFTDAAGMSGTAGDQFRFSFFDLNGQTPVTDDNTGTAGVDGKTDNWRGYWFGHRGGSGTGSAGSIRERENALTASDNPFAASGDPARSLGAVGGTPVTLSSSSSPVGGAVYSGRMALEKTPSGIALAGFLSGNGGTNIYQANDTSEPFPANYGAVAWLFGNALNVDTVNLQNVEVTYAVSNALQITSQPADLTVNPGQPATFSVSWTGSGIIPSLQWRENGSDIPNATNSTYNIPSTVVGQSGNTYSVVIQNVFGDSVTSSNATLSVIPDSVAPKVLSASSLVPNVINVVFSEAVNEASALDSSSYSLSGYSIAERTLVAPNNVALTLDGEIVGSNYTLTVQNVLDLSGNTVVTTNVPGVVHGFQGAAKVNITAPEGVGYAYATDTKIKVNATGADIFGTADEFEYVYKTYSGDFDVAVKVESLLNTDLNAKAGLMARATSAASIFADNRNVTIAATPTRFLFQYRLDDAGSSTAVGTPRPPTDFPNCWVRLARTGSTITGYTSTNFTDWTTVSSLDTGTSAQGAYPTDILLGLAVTSHRTTIPTEAVFSGFANFVQIPSVTISRTGNNVLLQWPTSGFTLQQASSLASPITWSDVSGTETGNQTTIAIESGPAYFRLRK